MPAANYIGIFPHHTHECQNCGYVDLFATTGCACTRPQDWLEFCKSCHLQQEIQAARQAPKCHCCGSNLAHLNLSMLCWNCRIGHNRADTTHRRRTECNCCHETLPTGGRSIKCQYCDDNCGGIHRPPAPVAPLGTDIHMHKCSATACRFSFMCDCTNREAPIGCGWCAVSAPSKVIPHDHDCRCGIGWRCQMRDQGARPMCLDCRKALHPRQWMTTFKKKKNAKARTLRA